jgi:hypothetical protein
VSQSQMWTGCSLARSVALRVLVPVLIGHADLRKVSHEAHHHRDIFSERTTRAHAAGNAAGSASTQVTRWDAAKK